VGPQEALAIAGLHGRPTLPLREVRLQDVARTGADELIVASAIYDHAKRLRSYEILAEVREAMSRQAAHA